MNLDAVDNRHLGSSRATVAASLDHRRLLLIERDGAAEFDLDAFGRPRADEQVVILLDHFDQRRIEFVAADAQRPREDQAVVDHRGDRRRPGADVDDERRPLVAGRPRRRGWRRTLC